MSAWLCIISQPRGYAIWPPSAPLGIFQCIPPEALQMRNFFSLWEKGVVPRSGVSGHPKNMKEIQLPKDDMMPFFRQHLAPPSLYFQVNLNADKMVLISLFCQHIFFSSSTNPRL